jgi:hypothetical protein
MMRAQFLTEDSKGREELRFAWRWDDNIKVILKITSVKGVG